MLCICIYIYIHISIYVWRFSKIGVPPSHPSHGWPWLSTETHGDLGIPHFKKLTYMHTYFCGVSKIAMTTTECPSLQFHPSEWADHCSLQKLVLIAKDGHKYQHANYVSLTLALCQPDVTIFQWDFAHEIPTQRPLKRSWKPFQSDIQPVLWPMDKDEWQMRTTSPFFRAKYQKPATYCYFQDRLRASGWFRAISSAFSSAGCWFHVYWLYGLSQKREIPETCHFHGEHDNQKDGIWKCPVWI
jgi:hypothetical protein